MASGVSRFWRTALLSLIVADLWQWTPFVVLLMYSGLQSLPEEPYEAASFHIYLQGFKFFNTGYASAVSYLLLIVTVVVIQWSLNRLRRAS